MRAGATGQPVTAHDFVFAWRLGLDPENASEYAFILYPIKNAEAINRGELPVTDLGARAIDARTLAVDFERPIAFFDKLTAFSTYLPVREDFYRATEGRFGADADQLLYNGPFMLTSWVHGQSLRLDRNPHYWDQARIRLDRINVGYITSDPNTRLNLFKDEKIVMTGLTAENLTNALEQRWHIHRHMDGSIFFLDFNHRDGAADAQPQSAQGHDPGPGPRRTGVQGDQDAGLPAGGVAVSPVSRWRARQVSRRASRAHLPNGPARGP